MGDTIIIIASIVVFLVVCVLFTYGTIRQLKHGNPLRCPKCNHIIGG